MEHGVANGHIHPVPRLPRPDLPDVPQHIVQRGNNRLPCFLTDDDRNVYLDLLGEALPRYQCRLHAYVLMSNHVHLLLTPSSAGAVSRLMQTFARNYAKAFNRSHLRCGTLWEGRYKSCLVDSETYLLACYRYIELNPVRAWMTDDPACHRWSSYHANALGSADRLLQPHPVYLALGVDPPGRRAAYRELVAASLDDFTLGQIRAYLQQQRALGSDRFQAMVQSKLQRFAAVRPAHRPRRIADVPTDEPPRALRSDYCL